MWKRTRCSTLEKSVVLPSLVFQDTDLRELHQGVETHDGRMYVVDQE